MSLTELKVVITEQNAAIVSEFITKLHDAPKEVKRLTEVAKAIEVVDAEEVKTESEAPKKEPAKRASRAKKPEHVEEEIEEQEGELEENQTADAGAVQITADDLRELQAKKVGAHRDAIIKKLNGLGAKNITSLDESKFTEYYNFLAELA